MTESEETAIAGRRVFGIGAVVSKTGAVYARNFVFLATLYLVLAIVIYIASAYLPALLIYATAELGLAMQWFDETSLRHTMQPVAILTRVGVEHFLTILWFAFAISFAAQCVADDVTQREVSVRRSLAAGFKSMPAVTALAALIWVFSVLALFGPRLIGEAMVASAADRGAFGLTSGSAMANPFVAVIGLVGLLSMVLIAVLYWLSVPAVVFERKGPLSALWRVVGLSRGARWRIIGLLLLVVVLAVAAVFFVSFVVGMVADLTGLQAVNFAAYVFGVLVVGWAATAAPVAYALLRSVEDGKGDFAAFG